MPYRTISYGCDECAEEYETWERARECEMSHIADKAVARASDRIAAAFEAPPRGFIGKDEG